jgi:hypothetical protein
MISISGIMLDLNYRILFSSEMVKTFTVLVMEDNRYYNTLLTRTLLNTCSLIEEKFNCSVRLLSFTDPGECLLKIRSEDLNKGNIIAFIDYYTGDGINGEHISKLIKKLYPEAFVVLLSQSGEPGRNNSRMHDYFVIKDTHAPALCCLYLEQFIDNKFS